MSIDIRSIDEDEREWLAAVGLMSVYWTTLESQLVAFLNVLALAADLPENEQPKPLDMTFNRQIRFWKDTAKKLKNQVLAAKSLKLADKTRLARNHRDLLLHGLTYRDDKGRYFALSMSGKKTRKLNWEPQRVPIPTSKILKNAYETRVLSADFFGHFAAVASVLHASLLNRLGAQGLTQGERQSPST